MDNGFLLSRKACFAVFDTLSEWVDGHLKLSELLSICKNFLVLASPEFVAWVTLVVCFILTGRGKYV